MVLVAKDVFSNFHNLPESMNFRIRVKGGMSWMDEFVDGFATKELLVGALTEVYGDGKPYKRYHGKGELARKLGMATGKFIQMIMSFFFPRGPRDGLLK